MSSHIATSVPLWVERAAQLPLAFAQVREDPLLDLSVLKRIGKDNARVIMIASGGCTAAELAASNLVSQLNLVDINPAQMALARLKLNLLESEPTDRRERILGHLPMDVPKRKGALSRRLDQLGLPGECLGPFSEVAAAGPDQCGRYERVFQQIQMEMRDFHDALKTLLNIEDSQLRGEALHPSAPLGQAFDTAIDHVMALPNLVRLFGAAATQNARMPFSRHFATQTRRAIVQGTTWDNPYLCQFLLSRYPADRNHTWLDMPAPARMPSVTQFVGTMDAALDAADGAFDYVHLSNILDWLDRGQATRTLQLAAKKLVAGGYILVRQLNSTLDIPSLSHDFDWLDEEAAFMLGRDRSFFYRQLHLGRRR